MEVTSARTAVAAVQDLMFGSRIRGAAQQVGVTVTFARSASDLLAHAAHADVVLLDLETRWLDAPSCIAALKADAVTARVNVVAFASHIEADALLAARAAGADRVLARSAFVKQLPELLRG